MRVLIDTNVLGRLSQRDHALNTSAGLSLAKLRERNHELRLVPQVLYEYWVVATRPLNANGLGFTIDETEDRLRRFKALFPLLRDERSILEYWELLVVGNEIRGKEAHDARLVAAMQRHGLSHLLTFNLADFQRYPGIELLDPQVVAAS